MMVYLSSPSQPIKMNERKLEFARANTPRKEHTSESSADIALTDLEQKGHFLDQSTFY